MKSTLLSLCLIFSVEAIFAANLHKTATPSEPVRPGTNATESIRRALSRLCRTGGGTLTLAPGDYHLYASEAKRIPLAVSNHDQPADHPVPIPVVGATGLTIEGNGARLLLHGEAMVGLIMNATNITIRNLSIDWVRPPFSEVVFQGLRNGQSVFSCDQSRYPFTIRDGVFVACGDDLDIPQHGGIAFRADTGELVPGSADIWYKKATKLKEDNLFALDRDFTTIGEGMRPGDIFVLRSFYRPHPAFCIHRSKDIVFENVIVHAAFGMAFLAQMSENVSLIGTKTAADKTCGVFPSPGRIAAHTVDATHFSNVKGQVRVKNAWFEGMMDDAINVHSTCLSIHPTGDRTRIRCRYMHDQAFGLGVFAAGDNARLIRGKTLENGPLIHIAAVHTINSRELELTLNEPLPEGYGEGDAIENATYQCAVEFRGNVVTHNRARGALFTTPLSVRVEDNQFLNVSGSAILFAGDAMNWYESGACEDVIVRGNLFRDCLTSRFQYCEGVISIFPEIRDIRSQTKRYHRNILIENNTFDSFETTLLFALSVDNLHWRKNIIQKNTRYPARGGIPFRISDCEHIEIQ